MALVRTGYEQVFEEIHAGSCAFGRASILPWDTETFGFPVAAYQTGVAELDPAQRRDFPPRFDAWMRRNEIALCVCTIPANDRFWKLYLPELNFRFVDFGLKAALNGLQTATLPHARAALRPARPEDYETIEALAAQSFRHGRYHADPLFPRELADLRYRHWMRRALSGDNPIDHVYVLGETGSVQGFYHVTIEGTLSDLRLMAVVPKLQATGLGFHLCLSVLHLLRDLGVRRVVTSISGANTAAMNVYSKLGFVFSDAEAIYHWHKLASGARFSVPR